MLKTTRETNDDASTNAVKSKGLNMLMGKLPQKPHMTRNNKKQRRTEIDPKGAYDRSATSLATNFYHLAFLSYAGPSSCSQLSMVFSILPYSFRIFLFLFAAVHQLRPQTAPSILPASPFGSTPSFPTHLERLTFPWHPQLFAVSATPHTTVEYKFIQNQIHPKTILM